MEIQIIQNWSNRVWVDTAVGSFAGIWCSSPPVVHKKYVVELDSDDVVTSDMVELSDVCNPNIKYADQIIITGLVEAIEDEIMILRLSKSLMMLKTNANFNFDQFVGHYVRVKLHEIRLYDTGIY